MSKEAYQQKLSAQIDEQKARLDQARARAKGSAADVRLETEEQMGILEKKIDAAKAKLARLSEAGEDAWEGLKDDAEKAWGDLSQSAKGFFARFKA